MFVYLFRFLEIQQERNKFLNPPSFVSSLLWNYEIYSPEDRQCNIDRETSIYCVFNKINHEIVSYTFLPLRYTQLNTTLGISGW